MIIMSDKDVDALSRKIDTILHYLHNDEGTGQKGLVAQVTELQKEFHDFRTKYEQQTAIKKAVNGVYGLIGGAILVLAKWIVEKVFHV
jgi:hypothetical protein